MVSKEVMVHTKSQLEDATVEARVLSSVIHFNIIRFISLQRSGPKLMIVMEYVLLVVTLLIAFLCFAPVVFLLKVTHTVDVHECT